MLIETWGFDRLYRYLWGGTTDFAIMQTNLTDLKKRLSFVSMPDINTLDFETHYILAKDGETIIGLLQYITKKNWHLFGSLGVDPNYQNQGVSKALIKHWIDFVYKPELSVCDCTDFTDDGFKWLKPQLENLNIKIIIGKKLK